MAHIVIRLSRFRLYLYRDSQLIKSYPIGIGKVATQTPQGVYTIVNKVPYPYSYPGGPLSPFGTLWMGLSRPHYGIHGTNRPSSIGKRVSKGCIRMHNRDVEDLARYVGIGTKVMILP
ncbi:MULTISPECIES: L,D-transpeptidase [unclassified Thermoactinomyces]|jgi:lipoprotein-anchoring transpeptidase ErfK/SrfK|uniref:L,D-transpeptidase n=1 Tax=unclassified Thermoactinomyces TaxID=2634588 RepID=UPI0018DCCBBD|nr:MULTISPECIES: L,D-transpeptidase [unclassified Thermoactinomyces]MBH8598455.1 L,D-transpeptidase [Thermoactinomyces sp. CICC 10523]MBH8604700.1 L,D-transpeptidase [Thermoactinomyces sp. CICC 10522]MBH8606839.1 L,D-transpeptidase [Thermoactinomyces sp. CICC 10521]